MATSIRLDPELEQRLDFLAAQTGRLELAAQTAAEEQPDFGSVLLRDVLREQPQHFVSSLASACAASQDTDDILVALTQIDEAIGALSTIALAAGSASSDSASAGGSSASPDSTLGAAQRAHVRATVASLRLPLPPLHDLIASEGTLATSLRGAAREQERQSAHLEASDAVLPAGSTLCRPFVASEARKRLRDVSTNDDHCLAAVNSSSSAPFHAPCGALGATPSARLERGDVLHVPFSRAEATILQQVLADAAWGRRRTRWR